MYEPNERAAILAAKKFAAAAAPDKAKLKAFAGTLRSIVIPLLNDETTAIELKSKILIAAAWCESEADKL